MILEVAVGGRRHTVTVAEDGDDMVVAWDGTRRRVRLVPLVGSEWWRLEVDGRRYDVRLQPYDDGVRVTVGASRAEVLVRRALPVPSRRARDPAVATAVEVRAPMPGLVVATPLAAGQPVAAGQAVVVVEAMKMQMEVPAPVSGQVAEVRVRPGQEVTGAQVLVVLHTGPGAGESR